VQDIPVLRKLVAQRAVDLVNQLVENQMTIGLAWGRTCYEFVSHFRTDKSLNGISVLPLIGGSDQTASYYQLNEMVRVLADKLNGTAQFIHAPAITFTREEREVFDKTPTMKMIRDKWSQMDLAVTGIGFAPTSRGLDRETYIGEHELHKQLIADMAAGDICARYFEESGKIIRGDIYDLVIGVPVEVLKETKQVICIAVGKDKVEAITGALRTGIIDTLITDERTGMAVLQHQSAKSDH
jgi:deoxyribonucleoside regulator